MNRVQEYVKALAEDRIEDTERRFPSYTSWLKRRFADRWETYNVTSEVADFGPVQWEGRSVDAIVVKSIFQQKNRILGKYDEACFLFAFVDDAEFTMERDRLYVGCDNRDAIRNWKIGKRFQSQWNVE